MIAADWVPNQANKILFVLIDVNGNEVSGLGATFTLEISKNGGAFAAGVGTKAEISDGWYSYVTTAAEADTIGPVAVKADHASTIQQNLEYTVGARGADSITFTYTVTNSVTTNPIEGVYVAVFSDIAMTELVSYDYTDSNGEVVFYLTPDTYYFYRRKVGFSFDNPDTEVVS